MRMEAVEAQQAQHVLADARLGIAHEPDAPGMQILDAADEVEDRAAAVEEDRVHGEVAPLGILRPAGIEGDARMAAERLDVAAQGRDLEGPPARDRGDRAMLDAGRNRLDAPF